MRTCGIYGTHLSRCVVAFYTFDKSDKFDNPALGLLGLNETEWTIIGLCFRRMIYSLDDRCQWMEQVAELAGGKLEELGQVAWVATLIGLKLLTIQVNKQTATTNRNNKPITNLFHPISILFVG